MSKRSNHIECPVETTLVKYSLTGLGKGLKPILEAMHNWGESSPLAGSNAKPQIGRL